ncbi:MAG: hypothetical protein ACU841_15600 [Gammaproteobacteria bacterium]
MDDATNKHYSMFFDLEVAEVHGLFSTLYTDRGSHLCPVGITGPRRKPGGKVDKVNLTQFGRAMKHLGIDRIAAYSPEARGRSERAFATHQGRLPKKLALAGVTDRESANRYLRDLYRPAFNADYPTSHGSRRHICAFSERQFA